VKVQSQSETTSSGKPWYFQILSRDAPATHSEFCFDIDMKWAIFGNLSTTTRIVVYPEHSGKSVIELVKICVHGLLGISNGCSNPCCGCLGAFVLWQLSHSLQYYLTSSSIVGEQKFQLISSIILIMPKCPATFESGADFINFFPIA
jgi:hypothetical protein